MSEIETLQRLLTKALPDRAHIVLDRPDPGTLNGRWWMEVELDGHSATIDWRANQGFGVASTPTEGYGGGADEVYPDAATAAARISSLLQLKERTNPPQEMLLGKLRQVRRVSQEQLAQSLNVNQAAISKMERRSDMYISTLRKVVAGMGGSLEIRARFPEGVIGINQFEDLQGSSTALDQRAQEKKTVVKPLGKLIYRKRPKARAAQPPIRNARTATAAKSGNRSSR